MRAETKHIISALPVVASILGDSLGVKVSIGEHSTAWTDGTSIFLPKLSVEGDETELGLVRGYISHEAGHIRYTDFVDLRAEALTALEQRLFNYFEDYRVEQRMAERYPGCRQDFLWLIRHLFATPFSREELENYATQPLAALLDYVLYSVRALSLPVLRGSVCLLGQIVENHYPNLLGGFTSLISRVTDCRSTRDCLSLAREAAILLRGYLHSPTQQEEPPEINAPLPSQTNSAAITAPAQSGQPTSPKRNKREKQRQAEGALQENEDQPAGENQKSEVSGHSKASPTPQEALAEALDGESTGLPADEGERIAKQLEACLKQSKNCRPHTAMLVEQRCPLHRLDPAQLAACKRVSNALQTRLGARLQTRVLRRSRASRSGRLDGHLLHRLATGSAQVFRQQAEIRGLDTTVHILLDCSCSMAHKLKTACASCYVVASALSRIQGVRVALTAFPATDDNTSVCPVFRPGERTSDACLVTAHGSTPMAEAMLYALRELLRQRERRKLLIVLTDGSPDDFRTAMDVIDTAERLGIEVCGIGIDARAVTNLFSKSAVIRTVEELPKALFGLLTLTL